MHSHGRIGLAALALGALCGCGGTSSDEGWVALGATGGSEAQAGFPSTEGAQSVAFADGWTLHWTKVLVSIGHVSLKGADQVKAMDLQQNWVVDLHKGDALLANVFGVPARRWERFTFAFLPVQSSPTLGPGVSVDDGKKMFDAGATYWFVGTAQKGTQSVTLDWMLKPGALDASCVNGADGTDGLQVVAGAPAQATISLHLAHLFFTKLGSETAPLRFQPIAALATGDLVSFDDLAKQPLTPEDRAKQPILDEQGQPVTYDPNGIALSENNLRGFVVASLARAGHLNGQGLCTATPQ